MTDFDMTGKIVTATFADGKEWRSDNCDSCSCDCHDDAPLPEGTYVTVRLDRDIPVGPMRVRVTEATR